MLLSATERAANRSCETKSPLPNKLKQDSAVGVQAVLHAHDIIKQNGYSVRFGMCPSIITNPGCIRLGPTCSSIDWL
ncbi:hypothetical protein EK904_001794, partial [Melospiza melodia maxima]